MSELEKDMLSMSKRLEDKIREDKAEVVRLSGKIKADTELIRVIESWNENIIDWQI